jgi:hypothetical protein
MSSEQPRERGSRFVQLAPALVGLLGVLVGAAATSGVTYWVDHSHGKAGERGGERIVLAEVQWNDHLKGPNRLTSAAWGAEQESLAQSLSNVEWAWVAKYYRDLKEFRDGESGARSRFELDRTCALVALNVSSYSQSQADKALSSTNPRCSKPPYAP